MVVQNNGSTNPYYEITETIEVRHEVISSTPIPQPIELNIEKYGRDSFISLDAIIEQNRVDKFLKQQISFLVPYKDAIFHINRVII